MKANDHVEKITPQMFVMDHYGLQNWSSLDMQLIIELEHRMFEFADALETVGEYPTYTGSPDIWQPLDDGMDESERKKARKFLKYE